MLSDKLINDSNLKKLAKALDIRNKQKIEEEKLRAETKESELESKINQLREDFNNSSGDGSGNYQLQYDESTEELIISGIKVTFDEETGNLQIGGNN